MIILNYLTSKRLDQKMKKTFGILDRYSIIEKRLESDETLLQDRRTGEKAIMKQTIVQSHSQFKAMIETLENQKYIRNEHILNLIDYQSGIEEVYNSCQKHWGSYKIVTIYQHGDHSLGKQIQSRTVNSSPFSEEEIWSILYSLVIGLSCLQKQGIGHGCITPQDIFLGADGSIKIVDPSISTLIPYQQLVKGYYYSPQMIQNFTNELPSNSRHYDQNQQIDIYRADVFTLAMCIAECCLLESMEQCYLYETKYENPAIIPDMLTQKFTNILPFYSEDLVNILYAMLSLDPKARPDFIELQQQLNVLLKGQQSNSYRRRGHKKSSSIHHSQAYSKSRLVSNCVVQVLDCEVEDLPNQYFPYSKFFMDIEVKDIADSSPNQKIDEDNCVQLSLNIRRGEESAQFLKQSQKNQQKYSQNSKFYSSPDKCFQSFGQQSNNQQKWQQQQNYDMERCEKKQPLPNMDEHFNFETSRKVVVSFNKNGSGKSKKSKGSSSHQSNKSKSSAQNCSNKSKNSAEIKSNESKNSASNRSNRSKNQAQDRNNNINVSRPRQFTINTSSLNSPDENPYISNTSRDDQYKLSREEYYGTKNWHPRQGLEGDKENVSKNNYQFSQYNSDRFTKNTGFCSVREYEADKYGGQQIFTDPKLLEMMQNDVAKIMSRRAYK